MNHNITNFEWKQKEKEKKSLEIDEGITLMRNYYYSIKNVIIKSIMSIKLIFIANYFCFSVFAHSRQAVSTV